MGLYSLQDAYSLSTWYENQGAYDLNAGTDLLLDQTRAIIDSDAYLFQGVSFPKGPTIFLNPGDSFSGSLQLTAYSYVVSLTGWSGNNNQFTLRIFDKGAQTDLYYGQFAWFPTVISNMESGNNMGQNLPLYAPDQPFGPYFFRDPLIVLPPGVLNIQVTNVATSTSSGQGSIQMLFGVAVPKSTVSMQNRKVTTGTDPSGLASLASTLVRVLE